MTALARLRAPAPERRRSAPPGARPADDGRPLPVPTPAPLRARAARRLRGALAHLLAAGLAALLPAAAPAQTAADAPRLTVEFETDETLPGQPLTLRMTLLVPTFLPEPPVWPSFDAPNLRVRLPSRATGPVSGRVEGQTWSGLSRRWQIAPLAPGAYTLPASQIAVTWADPDAPGGAPLRTTLTTPAIDFRAIVPEGAEDLSPFIAAADLTLERRIEGEPQGMTAGEALSVTLTATIEGASPMLLPPLAPPPAIEGLAAYPDEPELVETQARGRLSGTRTERISLLAQGGGAGELPALALRWWDIDEARVKTAEVPAVAISVEGPPAASAAAPDPAARLRLALWVGAGVAAALLALWLARRAAPPLRRGLAARRAARLASAAHAWAGLQAALRARDAAALRPALDLWASRVAGDPRQAPAVQSALLALGAARYAPAPTGDASAWRALAAALAEARRRHPPREASRSHGPGVRHLPPLNPVG
ncbi:hypothetical protein [uncultured Albimonas sp.]|uniref:hypothetical protein n=1 Tax=uncultured Albimonas sp. TaxID=1331701 RepID=UPI0030EB7F54